MLKKDLARYYNMKKGSKFKRVIGCYRTPAVHAIIIFRFGQWLLHQNIVVKLFLTPIYYMQNKRMMSKWGISLERTTIIEEGFYIGHYGGIFVSGDAKIGKNVNISQDVTIGVSGRDEKRGCPEIGDNVYIAPGAKLFGKIKIGNDVKIGANAVVYKDIPEGATVVSSVEIRVNV
ncbi:MAG: serine acetyltransferase [Sulfurovaceae bacterium]|nr:serine acetyltransferase [Sulfurovaceae bacterium]